LVLRAERGLTSGNGDSVEGEREEGGKDVSDGGHGQDDGQKKGMARDEKRRGEIVSEMIRWKGAAEKR
jgi:hypothetical protein